MLHMLSLDAHTIANPYWQVWNYVFSNMYGKAALVEPFFIVFYI